MKSPGPALPAIFATLALATPINAQVASAILREGDALPQVSATAVVTTLDNTSVNGVGGFGVTMGSNDGTSRDHIWGSANGLAPGILYTNQIVGTLDQGASIEFGHGIDDNGAPCYSVVCVDTVSLVTGLDSAWIATQLLAVEGDPIPSLPGKIWRFASRPGITTNGLGYFVGGIDDAGTGAAEGNGLFFNGQSLAKTGDLIPGLPGPLDGNAVDFDYRFSALGTHWIAPVDVLTGSSLNDGHLLLNGMPIPTSAGTIAEAQPIPAKLGGFPGENWSNFDYFSISESGEYMFTGDTDYGLTGLDEFVARDGVILYREGDVIDGKTLAGAIESAYMNEQGDIAYIWDVVEGTSDVEALFLNGKFLVKEGDAVDLDGDGIVDPGAILASFTGINPMTIGEDGTIYFVADIDVNGTATTTDDIEAVFVISDPCGSVRRYGAGCAGTGGFVPQLQLNGCAEAGGAVTLDISNGLGGSNALLFLGLGRANISLSIGCAFLLSSVIPSPVTLPLGGFPGLAGDGSLAAPTVIPITLPSVTFTMQAFVIDPASPPGAAATNALEVVIP